MKRVRCIVITFLSLMSCQLDDPDMFREDRFTKVFGLDGLSHGADVIELSNGDFIIVGNFNKSSSTQETIRGPFIIRTDGNGNQKQFRNFFITRGSAPGLSEYIRQSLNLSNLDSLWNVDFSIGSWTPSFLSVTPLKNGNLFLLGEFIGTSGGNWESVNFSLIMDETLKPLKITFLNNTDLELADGLERVPAGRDPYPILMDNGDVIALKGNVWLNYDEFYDAYGIIRFNESGEVIQVLNIPQRPRFVNPDSWILKDQDHVIICGTYSDPGPWADVALERDNDIWLQNINLTTGNQEHGIVFGKGYYNFTFRSGIETTSNGFVIGDYHADTVGQDWDYNDDGYRNIFGGLWFVDENLDSLREVHLTWFEVEIPLARLIKTTDGGYVAAYSRERAEKRDALFVKCDPEGNVLWRKVIDFGIGESLNVAKMVPTRDGGVAILGNINFNSMGSRVNLIKLSADGNL